MRAKVLILDNYDSFTYNLVQYFGELRAEQKVYRNDAISLKQIERMSPSHIVISPGPGRPEHAGISVDIIKKFAGKIPILGVCLGHQAIGYAFGGKIIQAKRLMHGKTSHVIHDGRGILRGIDNPFEAALQPAEQRVERVELDPVEQLFLARYVVVDPGEADAGLGGDAPHGGFVVAHRAKHPGRRIEQMQQLAVEGRGPFA